MQNRQLSGESRMRWFEKIFFNFATNHYNKKSGRELGWDPSWFGEVTYSKKLSHKISRFQHCYGLEVTGIVDLPTWNKFQEFAETINRIRFKTNKE